MKEISTINPIAPLIISIDDAIENCKDIINKAMEDVDRQSWKDSRVGNGEGEVNRNIRNTFSYNVVPNFSSDIFWFDFSQKLWQYGNEYGKLFNVGFESMENPQILRYNSGEGFYVPHIDSGPGNLRIFSLVLYLNDVQEGGETFFNHFDIGISPKEGRMVLFPSNYAYLHEARTPISGDKFVAVTWFREIL